MAEDQFQRPYRASEPPVRAQGKTPGSDPLAELARLIGQTDPFAEYGRESARRAPAPQPERSDWSREPTGTPYAGQSTADQHAPQRLDDDSYYADRSTPDVEQSSAPYGGQGYGRESYGGTSSTAAGEDFYQADREQRDYPSSQADYQHDAYAHDAAQFPDEEYYEDMPPSRRRFGVMAIVGVLALAVIGTAGAYGYRALFGSSGSAQPPPVIKADAGPTKIVPATPGKDAQSNKLITDRVNERGQSEKLVSREEQPVPNPAAVAVSQMSSQPSSLGSGVVGSEPKKVRTIAIHPDQPIVADATPQSAAPFAAAARPAPAARAPAPSAPPAARVADSASADAEQDAAPSPATRSAPAPRQVAPAGGNSPLSLSPDSPSARTAARPLAAPAAPAASRTATVAAPAQMAPAAPAASSNAGGPGSYVQVSSQRSEAEAQAAFRSLQAKYPDQLGGRQPLIHKVDLGAKGTYYRAMVGPFTNASEAGELCSNLKAAGGQCLIQRN